VLFVTAIGQNWKRAAGAALTIALLSAVAAGGLALLGSELFASGKMPENTEQALASSSAFEGLLNFETPAKTVARLETQKEEALLVKDWKYTANPGLLGFGNLFSSANNLTSLESLFASNPYLDFFIVLANNQSFNSFLLANPPLAYIVATGALYVYGVILENVMYALKVTNLPAARLIEGYVNFLRGVQASLFNLIPVNFRPPPIPPISPSF